MCPLGYKHLLFHTAMFVDKPHGRLTYEDFRVKMAAPAERCNISILVSCFRHRILDRIRDGASYADEARTFGSAPWSSNNWVNGATWGCLRVVHPEIRLRDDGAEERGVSAKAMRIRGGLHVWSMPCSSSQRAISSSS